MLSIERSIRRESTLERHSLVQKLARILQTVHKNAEFCYCVEIAADVRFSFHIYHGQLKRLGKWIDHFEYRHEKSFFLGGVGENLVEHPQRH